MTEYFHDIAGKKVLCVHNCSAVFTQTQKDAGFVVVSREIYEYLLVQYGQAAELVQPTYICYQCNELCLWIAPDGRCNMCTLFTSEEVCGDH